MSVILVDARYLGHYLKRARRTLNLTRYECGKILNTSHSEIMKLENGKILISERLLEKIMVNGLTMIMSKRRK